MKVTPKRINFIAIQQAQGIFADGYQPAPLRTGYEQVVAQRTTSLFAAAAEQDGEVIDVNKYALVVRYNDGKETSIELGKRFGNAAGVHYPHQVKTLLKKGDKVQRGDILAFNEKFFVPDVFDPKQVSMKVGVLCRVALMDNIDTLEDGSAISERVAELLNTQMTEIRTVEVRFDQLVHNLVQLGDTVGLDSILCTIEDPETAYNPLFNDAALDTLKRISSMTPRAKVEGTVTRVECFYHGDFDELSLNLQEIARESDRERKRRAKAMNEPAYTGQVDTSFRVKGNALDPDTMAIRIYIDHNVGAGVGDKGVFGNQMKTVFSRVLAGTNTTENGDALDAVFGNTSIDERMVHSPKLMGTTNTLLRVLSKHVAAVYRGKANVKSAKV